MRLSAGLAALLALGVAGPAQSELKSLRTGVADLEQSSVNLRVEFRPQQLDRSKLAEHRLVDAQVLYSLKDYTRAAIVLLDYVNKYKDTRGYPEALFFLADSLYQRRDFLSARRYFRQIVTSVRGPYYQEALQRLVELSLRTGDTADIKQYLDALANIPPAQIKPSVPYVRGKYYFFRGQTDEAMRAFNTIMRGAAVLRAGSLFHRCLSGAQQGLRPGHAQLHRTAARGGPDRCGEKHPRADAPGRGSPALRAEQDHRSHRGLPAGGP